MPASLTFEEYGDGIGNAWTVLRDNAARAGMDAAVPTCPGWTVRELVAHVGMVHRWATGAVQGRRDDEACAAIEKEGLASPDPLSWLDDGARDLLSALAFAPEDLDVDFFLLDAPKPRLAWARRQCHETTVHAVDAMAAARGGPPRAADTWLSGGLAADGVDELLQGFLPRRRRLRLEHERVVVVRAEDRPTAWTVRLRAGALVTTVGAPVSVGPGDTVLSGAAAQLYLGLWNRGDELRSQGPDVLDWWREEMTVSW